MRMRNVLLAVTASALIASGVSAVADYSYTDGVNCTPCTVFSFVQSGTGKLLSSFVQIDSTGTEKGTSGNPVRVDPVGTTTQPVNCVSGCSGGGGGGNVNITEILGAAPSAANPLWVQAANGASFAVTGTFWQTTQPISATSLPLPTGAATQTTLASILSQLAAPASTPVTGTFWPYALGQQLAASSVPVVLTAAQLSTLTPPAAITNYAQETGGNLATVATNTGTTNTDLGAPGSTACSTDTGSCNHNALLQRIAQRVTSLIGSTLSVAFNTSPSIANGNGVVPAPSSASAAGLLPSSTSALASSQTVKGSAGNLYSFEVSADSTLSAAAWWIMIFNATSLPADGAVTPTKCYAMPANATNFSAAFNLPLQFSGGIVIGVSSTGCFSKTASAHAFISGDAQ